MSHVRAIVRAMAVAGWAAVVAVALGVMSRGSVAETPATASGLIYSSRSERARVRLRLMAAGRDRVSVLTLGIAGVMIAVSYTTSVIVVRPALALL